MKKMIQFVSVFCLSLSLVGCATKESVKEIILYTDINSINWLDYGENYTSLESDRLDAFNKRLNTLGGERKACH